MKPPKVSTPFVRYIAIRALMALLLFMTLAAWSMGSAVGGSPDEGFVLTSIWCGKTGETPFCRQDPENPNAVIVPTMVREPYACYNEPGQAYSAGCQESIRYTEGPPGKYNTEDLYPDRYFDITRSFVGADVEESVVKIRLFNSFIAAVMILSSLSLDRKRDLDWLITLLAVLAPVTTFFISSVNTSSWLLIGAIGFVIAFSSVIRNRRKIFMLIPASAITIFSYWLANSSRHESKYILLFLAATAIYYEFLHTNLRPRRIALLVIGPILIFMYVLLKYVQKVHGDLNIFDNQIFETYETFTLTTNDLLLSNFIDLPKFIMGFFGGWGLGWFELELTQIVYLFSLQAFVLLAVFIFQKSRNIHRTIFVACFTIMCIAILYSNQQAKSEIGNVIQPRYFLPFFLGILLLGALNKTVRYPISIVISVAILATISNSISLRDTIRRYTTGQDVFSTKSLNSPREWWWNFGPQPETVWIVGSLAFAALFALIIYERQNEVISIPKSSTAEISD